MPRILDLAVIVPTYMEAGNVSQLVQLLHDSLQHVNYEIIFVDDDSPDNTAEHVRELAQTLPQVRSLHRIGRRGLSSACIEGIMATAAPVAAVIDGDLQHDERLLPRMLETLYNEDVEVVVGTRYIAGGGVGDWNIWRRRASELATWIAIFVTGVKLSDPMSGFFMIRTDTFRRLVRDLSGVGFKILLDIFASASEPLTFRELPYEFRSREHGVSKFDAKNLLEFLELLIARTAGRYLPTKFIMFAMVGSLGVIVHLAVLAGLLQSGAVVFMSAQIIATGVAMTFNFALNNFFTYYDRRLKGWSLITGWLSFCAASSVGAFANVGVAVYLFETIRITWFISGIAGILIGVVWNFVVTSLFTWKQKSV